MDMTKYTKYLKDTDDIVPGRKYSMTELKKLLPGYLKEYYPEVHTTLFVVSKQICIQIAGQRNQKTLVSHIQDLNLGLECDKFRTEHGETYCNVFYGK